MRTSSTEFKNLEGIVFEVQLVADKFIKDTSMKINPEGGYFYSELDSQVHKSNNLVDDKYYDENHEFHSNNTAYKVVATSNKRKFPELPRLTVLDLTR